MSEENKSEYPCTECEDDETKCIRQSKYLRCYKWRRWFRLQWEEIRNMLAVNVSNRHEKKGGDDK